MAVICIAGIAPGIGKTAIAELLLGHLEGWHAARVRLADEIPESAVDRLGDAGHALLPYPDETGPDVELDRLTAAGAATARVLLAEPRGLAAGLEALARSVPEGENLLVEGNAYLWGAAADLAIMVIGPGRSGKGLARVRRSARQLFPKIGVWVWNTRTDPGEEGFFDFPQAMARMGFQDAVTNTADFHHVKPTAEDDPGRPTFLRAVGQRLESEWIRRGSNEFLKRIGFKID